MDQHAFAFVKSHQEEEAPNMYECIIKRASKDSKQIKEETEYLLL